jgi:hypothetical protein
MKNRSRLAYANVVSTLALFLALSGGVALAASKIHTGDIFKRSVTSGKLALGAVRSNQIADGAVSARQIADGAVSAKQIAHATIGSNQIGAAAVAPSNLQFPVFFAASPAGGSLPVPSGEPVAYPLGDSTWTQKPGQIVVIFGGAVGTIARAENSGEDCRVFFDIRVNGQQTGGGELSTSSTTPERIERSVGASPEIDPLTATTYDLAVNVGSNGACTPSSTVDSTRFRVLDFG